MSAPAHELPPDLLALPAVLTVEEAARLLRIGRGAAYEAARTRELPTVRFGRTLRVPRRALLDLLGEAETVPADGDERS